jgi:flagellar protein FlgJ
MSVSPISAQTSMVASMSGVSAQPDRISKLPQDQQVKAVSGQFEAIMLRQLLQDSVSKIMGGDSGGPSGSVYGYLMTDVLATKLSEGGGLGLSKILQQQLSPHSHSAAVEAAPTPTS